MELGTLVLGAVGPQGGVAVGRGGHSQEQMGRNTGIQRSWVSNCSVCVSLFLCQRENKTNLTGLLQGSHVIMISTFIIYHSQYINKICLSLPYYSYKGYSLCYKSSSFVTVYLKLICPPTVKMLIFLLLYQQSPDSSTSKDVSVSSFSVGSCPSATLHFRHLSTRP